MHQARGHASSGPASSDEAGFSLLEVLVALTIVSLLAGAVALSLGNQPSAQKKEADRLVLRMNAATQDSLIEGQLVGFAPEFDNAGYQFFTYGVGQWTVATTRPALERHRLRPGVTLYNEHLARPRTGAGRQAPEAQPEVFFDPTGVNMPFAYRLEGEGDPVWVIRNEDGRLQVVMTLTPVQERRR